MNPACSGTRRRGCGGGACLLSRYSAAIRTIWAPSGDEPLVAT